jgi:ribosomal-protein-alanine N-acetyltransferase
MPMFSWIQKRPRVTFRPLSSAIAAQCAAIHAPAFAHAWSATDFEQLLSAENVIADGALDSARGRLVAMVISRRAADEAEVLTLAVASGRRRNGLGRALLATHFGRLSALGIRTLFLEVGADNSAARALYERLGFALVGQRTGYYRQSDGSDVGALILRRDLA